MNSMKPLRSMDKKKAKLNSQYIQYPLSSSTDIKIQSTSPKPHQTSDPQPVPADLQSSLKSPEETSGQVSTSHQMTNSAQANPFAALSELKATQQQYQMLRRRMQVLKLKQQKNNSRSQLNHRKLLFHSSIQKLASLEKQRISDWKLQTQERVESQRYSNLQDKLLHHKNVQEIQESLKETKLREYQQRKEEAKYHDTRIKQIQQQVVEVNKEKVQKIKKLELFSKLSIDSYNKQKLMEFKDKKFKETGSLEMKKSQKELEIKKLLELEMEMIERQSRSRILYNKSTEKLKQVLNPETGLRSSRINKNPSNGKMSHTELQSNHSYQEESLSQVNNNKTVISPTQKSYSELVTKASSYKAKEMKEMKGGFSLPEIRPFKKLA